ncbi:GCN5-related N-acetyltransferase [Fimicolochytrium jonesii]|uniref:GCN5-related N-acetyltransferase n=1 Tax=Fimicolochytrium jonesii TaxID=1396493 RepID=UPI0022FF0F53|nr:GCN5-related N-acetyltransferase [Fimicolochytrium jonesii]KAI8818318.1 GCN5-related N-acetyltransferase [Fimicolochytrium jonesii]
MTVPHPQPTDFEIRRIPYLLTYPLRTAILWPNHPSEVPLAADPTGLHYGLFLASDSSTPVSVISLFIESPPASDFTPQQQSKGKIARFRKFATAAEIQGKGYGGALLSHVFEDAKRNERITGVWCTARVNQVGFYEKRGMSVVEGSESDQKGVKHVRMVMEL